jgi:D-3-phosphoglycerate dehydrogenase
MSKVLAASQSFCKYSVHQKPGELLRAAGIEVDVNPKGKQYTESELLALIEPYDAIIVGADPITRAVIQKGKNLKIIAKNGTGYDNIDIRAATDQNIFVTFVPGAGEQTVADSTLALMLALARNIVKGDAAMRRGEWPRLMGMDICNKKLGIIGLGRIGKNVAARAKGFNMSVYAYDPYPDRVYCDENGVLLVDLDTLFRECDIITVHAPLNEETHHLVNAKYLAMMKPTALLINASRGGLVDEAALYQVLKEKKIAGAGIDVFSKEPPDPDFPLLGLDNVVLTPHTAGYSEDTLLGIGMMAAESVIAALRGEVPPNLVNREVITARMGEPAA